MVLLSRTFLSEHQSKKKFIDFAIAYYQTIASDEESEGILKLSAKHKPHLFSKVFWHQGTTTKMKKSATNLFKRHTNQLRH